MLQFAKPLVDSSISVVLSFFFPSSYRKSPIAASCLIVLRIDRFDVHFMCNLNHFTVKKLQLFLRTIIGGEF